MLFNSISFFIFFIIVYSGYLLFHRKTSYQNFLLLLASYYFYAAWDWRFLSLIIFSTAVDYWCGDAIARAQTQRRKKFFLWVSVVVNLSVLGVFKYFNFFMESLGALLDVLRVPINIPSLRIILPLGISFYTFQTMSYTIDIYRGRIKPAAGLLDFALFVAFFPQLVAGPIERAGHLLPQIRSPRIVTREKFYRGCYLIFWGLFMKVYIADNLASIVNPIFVHPGPYDGLTVLTGLYAFAFQIFCDFAGYSHIARGLCQCMGFDIMVNFRWPYFVTNPRDFWRHWHISLSSWLRDYLYIPLGGNKNGPLLTARNLMITMILGGLWHGAAWTFIWWGIFHGIILILHRGVFYFIKERKKNFLPETGKIIVFFHLTCLGWLIFRASSLEQVVMMFKALLFQWEHIGRVDLLKQLQPLVFFTGILVCVQMLQYKTKNLMVIYESGSIIGKGIFYYICFLLFLLFGQTHAQEFIYFQF